MVTLALRPHARRHGGSGVVVSWGCAGEVARLAGRVGARPLPAELAAGLPPLGEWARL